MAETTTARKIYFGDRATMSVYVEVVTSDGVVPRTPLEHIVKHSPTGFEWGYEGSGPLDLAYAILADFGSEMLAEVAYRGFAFSVISRLPRNGGWTLTQYEIANYIAAALKELGA